MKVFGHNFFSNFMHRVKSAKLAISKVALLISCMEFEFFCGQMPILGKKVIFSKGHPYSISILVS
jgi:hypothetical protein